MSHRRDRNKRDKQRTLTVRTAPNFVEDNDEQVLATVVHCVFNQGPKHGEAADLTVPAERGHPQEITVVAADPDTLTMRNGLYRQSALAPSLYVWAGWTGDAVPMEG